MTRESIDLSSRVPRIAIVGGGPGGMFTAWHLEQAIASPLSLTIFEASHRLGGKVHTPSFRSANVCYEAGAAEFYDYSPVGEDPLREMVSWFGLPMVSLGGASVFLSDRQLANLNDVKDVFGAKAQEELIKFDVRSRSAMTPLEFYESGSGHASNAAPHQCFGDALAELRSQETQQYIKAMIHSDLATEPMETDIGYGLQNYLMNDPAYMQLYCIAGGNEQLIFAIAARLEAELRFNTKVLEVSEGGRGGMCLQYQCGEEVHYEEYDRVVLALPMDALRHISFQGDTLSEAMQKHIHHHDHPAHYLRVSVLLSQPVHRLPGDDAFLMLDSFGGTCLYIESTRDPDADYGVLGWLLGGKEAVEMSKMQDEALVASVLDTLPPPLATCREHVVESQVHRWNGAVSALPGGWTRRSEDMRHRPSSDHKNLFVVGDYLYDSTLNGVLDSAEYVSGWIAAEHMKS
ncbi:MAG: FAD-dependent oxidoreductase [Pirellulales bacterium]